MIFVIRVDGEYLACSPRDTIEATRRLLELRKQGKTADRWGIVPEFSKLGRDGNATIPVLYPEIPES